MDRAHVSGLLAIYNIIYMAASVLFFHFNPVPPQQVLRYRESDGQHDDPPWLDSESPPPPRKKQVLLYVTCALSELSAWGGTFQLPARRLAAIERHATTTQDAAP